MGGWSEKEVLQAFEQYYSHKTASNAVQCDLSTPKQQIDVPIIEHINRKRTHKEIIIINC